MDYTHCHKQCLAKQDEYPVEMKEFAVWSSDNDCTCLPYSFEDCYKFGVATRTYGNSNSAYIVGDIYEGIYEKKPKTCKTDNYNALVPFTIQSSGKCNVPLSKEECEAYSDYIFQDVTKSSLTWELKDIHVSPYNYIGSSSLNFINSECKRSQCSSSHVAMNHDTCRAFCINSNKLYFSRVEDNNYIMCRCADALDDLEENQKDSGQWGIRYTTGTYEIHRSPSKVHTWNIYALDTMYTNYDLMIKVRSGSSSCGEQQTVYSGTQQLLNYNVGSGTGVAVSKFRLVNDQWEYVSKIKQRTYNGGDASINALQAFIDGFRKGELLILTYCDEMTKDYGGISSRVRNLKEHFGAEYLPLINYYDGYTLISIKDVGKIYEERREAEKQIIRFIGLNFWERSQTSMASGCVQTMDYHGNKALVYNTKETEYECTGEAKCICKNEFYDPPLQFPYVLTPSTCVDSVGTKEEFVNARSWFNIHERYNFEYHERLLDAPVPTGLKAIHPLRITGGTAGDGVSWRGAHNLKVFQYDPTLWILCNSNIHNVRMVGVRVLVINGEYYIRYEEGRYRASDYVDLDETNFYLYWQQGTVAVPPTATDTGAYTLDHIWGELDLTFETICKNSKQSCVELSESFDWPKYCTEQAPLLASYRFDTHMLDDHNENINLVLYNEKQNVDFIRLWAKPTSMVLESGEFAVYSEGVMELVVTRLYFHKGQIFLNNLELLTSCPLTDKQCLEKMSYVPNEWIQLKLGFDYQNREVTFYYNNNVVVKQFHCMNENAPETTTETLQCSGMGERITRIEAKDGTAKTYYDEITLEKKVVDPPLVSECGTYKYCNVNVNYREKCVDVLMNVQYPLLIEPKQDIMKVCSEHKEYETFSKENVGSIENEIAMKRLNWNKYCLLHELIKENINEEKCGVQHLGLCGPESHVLATSEYPQCVTECRHHKTCSAVHWKTDTGECNLLQSCLVVNNDVENWAHMFVKDHTYFEDFQQCIPYLNEMEGESKECVREAFKTNWTSYCGTVNSLTVPEDIKSKCPEKCYNGLRKDTELCPKRLELFSGKDTLLTTNAACPSVDMAEYCYDVAQGKDEGFVLRWNVSVTLRKVLVLVERPVNWNVQ